MEKEVLIRMIDVAFEITKMTLPNIPRDEQAVQKVLKNFDDAYKGIAKTVLSTGK
ncbi:hypothetical protein ACFLWX_02730 [Chloroflexota bacterium]